MTDPERMIYAVAFAAAYGAASTTTDNQAAANLAIKHAHKIVHGLRTARANAAEYVTYSGGTGTPRGGLPAASVEKEMLDEFIGEED